MSFNGRGEYVGHTNEDDEYEHTLRVGAFVEHREAHWQGEVQEIVPYGAEDVSWVMYRIRWDAIHSLCDSEFYAEELRVLG